MRRITLVFLSTVALLVLLFSYHTSLGGGVATQPAARAHIVTGSGDSVVTTSGQGPDPSTSVETTAAPGSSAGASPTVSNSAAPTQSTGAAGAAATPGPLVVDGDSEMTRYGPLQVRVTITAGRIVDVTAIQYPTAERRDLQINSFALPQLSAEVLAAQSAKVDVISGATYTTEGYLTSLQSALDAAHFGS